MIRKQPDPAKQWSPAGFAQFVDYYPATAWSEPAADHDKSERFRRLWHSPSPHMPPRDIAIVLTPGLFAEWLPRCFRDAKRVFEQRGYRVLRSKVRTGWSIREQAARLHDEIIAWLQPGEYFTWCTHSLGGLGALWALEQNVALRKRCRAAIVVQVPVGHSWVIDKWWSAPASIRETIFGRMLRSNAFAAGAREVSQERDAAVSAWLETFAPMVPVLQVVSWSQHATSWVDSYHRELNALRPGHAHDGQFYLADQLLPTTPVICLPALDHAQPVLGGQNLDVERLWSTLLNTAWLEVTDGQSIIENSH